jgi:hypothetical protein
MPPDLTVIITHLPGFSARKFATNLSRIAQSASEERPRIAFSRRLQDDFRSTYWRRETFGTTRVMIFPDIPTVPKRRGPLTRMAARK